MIELIADYGIAALTWLFAILTGLLARYVWVRIANEWARGVFERAWQEVRAGVLEVMQTYVKAIKAARADGKLTDSEKATAWRQALDLAKSNIGAKGLKALARILGADQVDAWLGNKIEAAVATTPTRARLEVAPTANPPRAA